MPIRWPDQLYPYSPILRTIAAPIPDIADEPAVCVRLNHEWRSLLLGAAEMFRWPDLFVGNAMQRAEAAQRASQLLLVLLLGNMECCEMADIRYRQNPGKPCLLEVSYDGGGVWETMFDYSLCLTSKTTTSIVNINNWYVTNQQIETDRPIYNHNVNSWTPDWNYGDANDSLRDMALCYAITSVVDTICDSVSALAGQTDNDNFWNVLDTIGGYAGLTLDALKDAVENVFSAATAGTLIGAIANKIEGWIKEAVIENISALDVAEARQEVICWMYDIMHGHDLTFAQWAATLAAFSGSPEAAVIAEVVYVILQSEDIFMELLKVFEPGVGLAIAGELLPCECLYDWEVDLDLSLPLPGDITLTRGVWVNGTGVHSVDWGAPEYVREVNLRVGLTPATKVQFIQVYFNRHWGTFASSSYLADEIRVFTENLGRSWSRSVSEAGEGIGRQVTVKPVFAQDFMRIRVVCHTSTSAPSGYVDVTRLRLAGIGTPPTF